MYCIRELHVINFNQQRQEYSWLLTIFRIYLSQLKGEDDLLNYLATLPGIVAAKNQLTQFVSLHAHKLCKI